MSRKTEEGRAKQREYAKQKYANLTPEQRELRILRRSVRYYRKKGEIPYSTTPLAKWCIGKGYDITKVISGEQPI